MGSATPEEPVLLFISRKPHCVIFASRWRFRRDMGAVHHEVELAVLIGATLRGRHEDHVRKR